MCLAFCGKEKQMASIVVSGRRRICGEARVTGAKNAALPILAATLIARGPVELENCPRLKDVENMLCILSSLGAQCEYCGDTLKIDTRSATGSVMPQSISKELRSSIFMLGPLLTRFGSAVCTFPGGCEIGHRPIDLHLKGLMMLGAEIREERGLIICSADRLKGAEIHLDYPSVGATENIMMAAACADGMTRIFNAAREPEIEDLALFLNELGYLVEGAGSSTLSVYGGEARREKTTHRIIPDRIVAGTLMAAAAITGGEIRLNDVCPAHVGSIAAKLKEAGCKIEQQGMSMRLSAPDRLNEIRLIETMPYPGFPTDMQAQMFALCAVAKGTSVIVENVFENRFRHAAELGRMGASFTQKDRTAIIRGVERLTGTKVTAWDLRGGAAMVLAGLAADGETTIEHSELIDRGYEKLHETLNGLGAEIRLEE